MAWPAFENAINSGMTPPPNDMYRNLQQAFINDQWDNTTAIITVGEETEIGSFEFNDTEVWVTPVVEDSSTGRKNGKDFLKFIFQNLTHTAIRGTYYQVDDNYWLGYFSNEFATVVQDISVRRCNNFMRIVDPENGSVFSIPCVVDYDMSSPSVQVSEKIIVPNNHAVVMVQGNENTLRLFKTNTRYILGGRPFKLYGIQNAIEDDYTSPSPTLLYIDLYLDEIRANDNLALQLADNGTYNYTISINSQSMELNPNSTGTLTADITLNGQEADGTVVWSSSNPSAVTIDSNGAYTVVGAVGSASTITAQLEGNIDVVSTITITVVDVADLTADIIIDPSFSKIREYENVAFDVSTSYGGNEYSPTTSQVSLADGELVLSNQYLTIAQNGNSYTLTCTQRTTTPQLLYVTVANTTPQFNATTSVAVECVSMMG